MVQEPKRRKLPIRGIVLSAVALPIIVWIVYGQLFDIRHRPIEVTGTIQAKEIPVASKIGGRIAEVHVQEGQEIQKGDVLVDFEVPELEAKRQQLLAAIEHSDAVLEEFTNGPRKAEVDKARAATGQALANWQMLEAGYRSEDLQKAQAQVDEARSNYDMLKSGYRSEEVKAAENQLEQARVLMEWQKQDWQRFETLSKQGAVSSRDASDLKSKYDAGKEAYEAAQENYNRMRKGPRPEEIRSAKERLQYAKSHLDMIKRGPRQEEKEMARQEYLSSRESLRLLEQGTRKETIARAKAELAQAKAHLSEMDAQLKERRVVSPANAEVSVMDLHAGEVIAPGKSIATLTKLDDVWTRVYVPERELGRVRMGQEVEIKADSFPGRLFRGRIVQIPSVAEFTPRNVQTAEERSAQVFGLKVQIDNKDHLLRGGMNAEITLSPVEGPFAKLAGH